MKIIGLTGGIATGKSTVSQFLKQKGFDIIDADQIARYLVAKGSECLVQITQTFGEEILLPDGELNRKKLGNIIFNDEQQKAKLDKIMQPAIFQEIQNELQKRFNIHQKIVFIDMPLLIEMGYLSIVDEVWLVYTNSNVQLERLMTRDNLSKEQALSRIQSQLPIEDKIQYSDIIIDNNYDMLKLSQQVDNITDKMN